MSAILITVPALSINPTEWSYLAEGGFHIILRYDGEDPELTGRILRIGKKALGHQEEKGEEGDKETTAHAVVVPDEAGARRKFARCVLIPLLGEQYVQPGDAVMLSREDIEKIHNSIDHLRPAGRMKKDVGDWSSACQLEPDKTAFWLKAPSPLGQTETVATLQDGGGKKDVVIAVEVKPKGAVMPVGTLVPPGNNRLKYRVARFDAQQRFKAQGKQSWGSINRPCLYHPHDFYSGDAERAASTLKELMKTPQNKLRAWENGNMLFGAGSGRSHDQAAAEEALDKAVVEAGLAAEGGRPAEALMDLVGEILAREPLVSKLVAAQALDVLEVEGGGLVFDKLVSLCGGSRDEALNMLEDQESEPFVAEEPDKDLLVPAATLEALRAGSPMSAEGKNGGTIDELHAKGLLAVEKLSAKDCVQLLRRYIIGLGVMDCSVMMSLKLAPAPAATSSSEDGEGAAQPTSVQGKHVAGLFQTPDGRRVTYCISVVDAGPKPPTKLSRKAKHEDKIWDFVAGLEDAGEVI